jgi:hypothetical protein
MQNVKESRRFAAVLMLSILGMALSRWAEVAGV